MIEIPLDDRDAKLLPPLYEYFKSFWFDASQEPRARPRCSFLEKWKVTVSVLPRT